MTGRSYSPISKLHVELLWTIFSMNTLTDIANDETDLAWNSPAKLENQDRPLTIIRRSSQVCRTWRAILLASPSLWGKVIDMSLLCGLAWGHWMNEVIRRSGQQVLHITTDNVGVSSRLPALVVLLDDHWERIRALNVTLTVGSREDTIVGEISRVLRRPAESLRSFRVEFKYNGGMNTPNLTVKPSLFSNHAPCLTAFHCAHSYLNLPSSWLSQLRTLQISLRTGTYTLPMILEALEGTPALETLYLSGASVQPGTTAFSKNITLPNLKFMRFGIGRIMTFAKILDTLIVPPRCSLIVYTDHEDQLGEELDIARAYQTFHRYFQNYFRSHTATSLLLSMSSHNFTLRDGTNREHGLYDCFALRVFSKNAFTSDEWSHIYSSFADAKFKNIVYIKFEILTTSIRPDDPNLIRFISGLLSVERMELVEPTLRFILSIAKDIRPVILPKLHSLIYTVMPERIFHGAGPVLPFLKWRRDAGIPIEKIDFTALDYPTFTENLDFLDEMTGLKVAWYATHEKIPDSRREYVCGSDNKLNLSW